MISADIEASTLEEYYQKLYQLQAGAHTPQYMLVHDEIVERLQTCSSYTEMGINQGATLAAAMLRSNLTHVRAYDVSFAWYGKASHHFEAYAKEKGINYKAFLEDTHKCVIEPVDLLYIDTLHKYDHLRKELQLHAHKASKFIICHDTFARRELFKAITEYVVAHPEWRIVNDCQISVGFTTIQRT